MLETMTTNQLLGWIAYFKQEPFGFDFENYRFGLIPSAIYNVNRQSKLDKLWEPFDFFGKPDEKQTNEEMIRKLDSIFISK